MFIDKKRRIAAAEETEDMEVEEFVDEEPTGEVTVEETDLLFEAEDVAQLIAEVTGESVDVTVNDDGESVDFAVGKDVYTVQAEGDEEILETSSRALKNKKAVAASSRGRRPVKAGSSPKGRRVRTSRPAK